MHGCSWLPSLYSDAEPRRHDRITGSHRMAGGGWLLLCRESRAGALDILTLAKMPEMSPCPFETQHYTGHAD